MSVFILLIAYRLDDALSRMTHGPFCMTARRVALANGFGQRCLLKMLAQDARLRCYVSRCGAHAFVFCAGQMACVWQVCDGRQERHRPGCFTVVS